MRIPKLILGIALVLFQEWSVLANSATTRTQSSVIQTSDANPSNNGNRDISASSVLGSMYRKSRQSRCVRCYEDRYGYDDRYRGGYSSRSSDDRNWYYPSYDYDRYYSSNYRDRDDRYSSRSYDRYEPRGYGDRYGADRYGGDRYGGDRYGGDRYGLDRYGDRYGDRYDDRRGDSYKGRYEDTYRDRYYDRYRDRAGDRDYYDRYSSRYDYRNYRPWDETYRGQSGFDNTGRGYYFAGDDNRDPNNRRYLPETGRRCSILVTNCPYDRNGGGMQPPPRPIDNDNRNNGFQNNYNSNNNNASNSNRNSGWNYMNEQSDSQHTNRGGVGGSSNSGSPTDRNRDQSQNPNQNQNQNRNQQSSSYSGRPPRPLGGSYLFDRESNDVSTNNQGNANKGQTGNEAQNDGSINQQPRDGGPGNLAGGPEARMMTGPNEVNKQS